MNDAMSDSSSPEIEISPALIASVKKCLQSRAETNKNSITTETTNCDEENNRDAPQQCESHPQRLSSCNEDKHAHNIHINEIDAIDGKFPEDPSSQDSSFHMEKVDMKNSMNRILAAEMITYNMLTKTHRGLSMK